MGARAEPRDEGRRADLTSDLCLIPGLSGHEEPRAPASLRERSTALGLASRTDRLGNLIADARGRARPRPR